MSEFPEVFHIDAAKEVLARNPRNPDVLAEWFNRAIEEVETLRAQIGVLQLKASEFHSEKLALEAKERFRLFKEARIKLNSER